MEKNTHKHKEKLKTKSVGKLFTYFVIVSSIAHRSVKKKTNINYIRVHKPYEKTTSKKKGKKRKNLSKRDKSSKQNLLKQFESKFFMLLLLFFALLRC